uniref:B30.2/SPRY domain-containing protein n=1 Tax=Ditylenchus dipsaci TaxID=166011 RepID=A0A915DMU6_9BILA
MVSARVTRLKALYPHLDEQSHALPSCLVRRVTVFGLVDPHPDCEFVDEEDNLHARFKPKTRAKIKMHYVVEAPNKRDVAIGIAERYSHDRCFPGVQMDSYGYNQDGSIYQSAKILAQAESFKVGDIVGCGVDFVRQEIFFTKNGKHMKTIPADLPIDYPLVPVIGFSFFGQILNTVRLPPTPILTDAQAACQAENWKRLYENVPSSLLPSCLDPLQRRRLLAVSEDNLNVTYIGLANPTSTLLLSWLTISCQIQPIAPFITSKKIAIGLAFTGQHLGVMLGWQESSVAYHGDDGHSFGNCNVGLPYGPKFQTGDVIGCAVDNTNQRVFYTHNGKRIPGVAFDNFLNEGSIYPAISMIDKNASVHLNFGQEPWLWKDVFKEAQKARRRSLKTSIKKSPPSVAEEQLHAAPEDPFHPAEAGPSITLISNIKPPLVLKTSNSSDVVAPLETEIQKKRTYSFKELVPTPKKLKVDNRKVVCQLPVTNPSQDISPVITSSKPSTSFSSLIASPKLEVVVAAIEDAACNTSDRPDELVWCTESGCQTQKTSPPTKEPSKYKRNEVIAKCQQVRQLIKEGKVKQVIKALEEHFHGLFEVNQELKLWLRLQQFVENISPVMKAHIVKQKALENGIKTNDTVNGMTSSQLRKKGKALHEEIRSFHKTNESISTAALKKKLESALLLTFESSEEKIADSDVVAQKERNRLAKAVRYALFQHAGMTAGNDMF